LTAQLAAQPDVVGVDECDPVAARSANAVVTRSRHAGVGVSQYAHLRELVRKQVTVPSVEPSSTTTTSQGRSSWSRTDSSVAPIQRSAL
jgi:hypothetical protein